MALIGGITKAERTKEKILEAAEMEFSEKGLYGSRVDEIAKRANINKRMLYEYFGNKEDLYKIVLHNVYGRLGEREAIVFSKDSDCIQAIKDIIRTYFEFLQANPSFINMVMWENLNKGRYLEEAGTKEVKDPAFKAIKKVVLRGKQLGVFNEYCDDEQVILSLINLSFSYFSNIHTMSLLLRHDLNEQEHIDKRIEHVTAMILAYLTNNNH